MSHKHTPPPPCPPGETEWRFVEELSRTPYHQPLRWKKRGPRGDEVGLADGVRLDVDVRDPRGYLETATADFAMFLHTVNLRSDGDYPIRVRNGATEVREAFRVEVSAMDTVLTAADPDGIRRGLIWIEDEMQRRGGPFLPLGRTARRPWVRTRISRCFFGPINRPPRLREELADDTDYYPDEYLNRLVHEGVNGLWLTINWYSDLPSRIIPEYGKHSAPRLARLRRTVAKCARYGIRVYAFSIEPAAFSRPAPELAAAAAAHPDLVGHRGAFCISAPKGKAYIEEATRTLFTAVPELGGLIVISVGERPTHCCSSSYGAPECPRCSTRDPVDVLGDTVAAMRRGMDAAQPEAELISWPYGQAVSWGVSHAVEAAGHVPAKVCLQHNFETGGWNRQLGKRRPLWDYWQSVVGPTSMFRNAAKAAAENGTRTFAKLQVACGHEVTTTQYVPMPGILHQKYRQMRKLGVSGAMLSWLSGAYPCVMTRASSELSFEPHVPDKRGFLLGLARRDWGDAAPKVVAAWTLCEEGYRNYPTAHIFQYFGPMHEGVVWPLHLVPRRLPLAPFWQLNYPPSGDHIADCITNGFTYDEILTLCKRMADKWAAGARIMARLLPRFERHPDRRRDILVTMALGLQFRSGHNILRFYGLREALVEAGTPGRRCSILKRMEGIVRQELAIDAKLLPLVEAEPVLGFNSEAEGYKYWPELIRWRMAQLEQLLRKEFPKVERMAKRRRPLFPDYTGVEPTGLVYRAAHLHRRPAMDGRLGGRGWDELVSADCAHWLRHVFNMDRWKTCGYDAHDHFPMSAPPPGRLRTSWKAGHDGTSLYIGVTCSAQVGASAAARSADESAGEVQVIVEPERTLPRIIFRVEPDHAHCMKDDNYIKRPKSDDPWRVVQHVGDHGWSFVLRIPLRWLRPRDWQSFPPLRINVRWSAPVPGVQGELVGSWAKREPVKGRLVWGTLNPATDFGWLQFDRIAGKGTRGDLSLSR